MTFFFFSDGVIQKLQQHYNQSGGPALGVTLSTVQEELGLSPPHVLTMDEIQLSNGVANGHAEQAASSGLSRSSHFNQQRINDVLSKQWRPFN